MKIFRGSFQELGELEGSWAVTLGTFDGVHLGHAAILSRAFELTRSEELSGSLAITFGRHPRAVLTPSQRPRLLTTLQERIALLDAAGLDRLYVLDFEEKLQLMEYDEFVRRILRDRLHMAHFILGHDVHFGRGRRGTSDSVRALATELGFGFSQVESVEYAGEAISSSRIREAIERGDLAEATAMLGHPYLLVGPVEGGQQIGRELGFPTANLRLTHPAKLLPPHGVYAAWARVVGESSWVAAALNLGPAPTLKSKAAVGLEVHLLETSPDLYHKQLAVAFGPRLRSQRRFASAQELSRQIARDVARVPELLKEATPPQRPQALGSSWDPQEALEGTE